MSDQKLLVRVSDVLAEVLSSLGFDARANASEKYIEALVQSDTPVGQSVLSAVERRLADCHVKMLGVSAVKDGYRVWGVAFGTAAELQEFVAQQENMLSHKEIGAQMELFFFHQQSPGEVFYCRRGVMLCNRLRAYLGHVLGKSYQPGSFSFIETPTVLNKSLWAQSGHLENFSENMQFVDDEYALKPMNCPGHILHYKHRTRSYRDLPLRVLEYGKVYRNEPSGALNGLFRLKSFTQDDGHIFCTIPQILEEVRLFMDQTYAVYRGLGFNQIKTYLATRPDNYAGNLLEWEQAETMLRTLGAEECPGEGAFYGPKIEFHLEDARGRQWQCGTVQLDFALPERMEMQYADAESQLVKPVILHRAILGSIERFLAILLESTQGWLPVWLAPVQVIIVPINSKHQSRANALHDQLLRAGVQVVVADAGALGKQVKRAYLERIPKVWIVGDAEVDYVTERDTQGGTEVKKPDQTAISEMVKLCQFPAPEFTDSIPS